MLRIGGKDLMLLALRKGFSRFTLNIVISSICFCFSADWASLSHEEIASPPENRQTAMPHTYRLPHSVSVLPVLQSMSLPR